MKIIFKKFLQSLGLSAGQHITIHSSFRAVRGAFPGIEINDVLDALEETVGKKGSLIMPAFTYCFQKKDGSGNIFDRDKSPSLVGALTEEFRKRDNVVRTSSATHSFLLWGEITHHIDRENAPPDPLGEGSVMEWIAKQDDAHILLLGADFSSLTFIHYLEKYYDIPWHNLNPWDDLSEPPIGLSVNGNQHMTHAPGCSRQFTTLENHLLHRTVINRGAMGSAFTYFFSVPLLIRESENFLKTQPLALLCQAGTCRACDKRRNYYHTMNTEGKSK